MASSFLFAPAPARLSVANHAPSATTRAVCARRRRPASTPRAPTPASASPARRPTAPPPLDLAGHRTCLLCLPAAPLPPWSSRASRARIRLGMCPLLHGLLCCCSSVMPLPRIRPPLPALLSLSCRRVRRAAPVPPPLAVATTRRCCPPLLRLLPQPCSGRRPRDPCPPAPASPVAPLRSTPVNPRPLAPGGSAEPPTDGAC